MKDGYAFAHNEEADDNVSFWPSLNAKGNGLPFITVALLWRGFFFFQGKETLAIMKMYPRCYFQLFGKDLSTF